MVIRLKNAMCWTGRSFCFGIWSFLAWSLVPTVAVVFLFWNWIIVFYCRVLWMCMYIFGNRDFFIKRPSPPGTRPHPGGIQRCVRHAEFESRAGQPGAPGAGAGGHCPGCPGPGAPYGALTVGEQGETLADLAAWLLMWWPSLMTAGECSPSP